MSTSDHTGSHHVPEAPAAGPERMDALTTQQMVREMTTLTNALFSLLQPHRAPAPETTTSEPAPSSPAAAVAPAVRLPQPPAPSPVASIPLPSLPVPAPVPPEPEAADEENEPTKDSRLSMALMNEIAFLDE